jgi:hypothetical protein
MQVCWVVPDIQAAIQTWAEQTGVGPFFYFDDVRYENAIYCGSACKKDPVSGVIGV